MIQQIFFIFHLLSCYPHLYFCRFPSMLILFFLLFFKLLLHSSFSSSSSYLLHFSIHLPPTFLVTHPIFQFLHSLQVLSQHFIFHSSFYFSLFCYLSFFSHSLSALPNVISLSSFPLHIISHEKIFLVSTIFSSIFKYFSSKLMLFTNQRFKIFSEKNSDSIVRQSLYKKIKDKIFGSSSITLRKRFNVALNHSTSYRT